MQNCAKRILATSCICTSVCPHGSTKYTVWEKANVVQVHVVTARINITCSLWYVVGNENNNERFTGYNSKARPPEYKAGMLVTRQEMSQFSGLYAGDPSVKC